MVDETVWLSLEDTASYLSMGKTALYALAREGKIPARKLGKKWTFEKAGLDAWVRSSRPLQAFFLDLEFKIDGNENLRDPQREGYLRTYEFFRAGKNKAILQIPVGCGKTGLATILPLGLAEGRVIVIAPNLTIRDGLYEAMDITNRQKCFWRKAAVLSQDQMISGPLATTLDSGNITVASKSHVVITNVQQLATNVYKWLTQFPDDFFDMIIVDEAHHSAAASWQRVIERFPKAKVVLLTATPFRSDRQELDGQLVFRYPFRNATLKGYIKRLKASYVAPSTIQLSFTDEGGRTYTLAEVEKLKEEDWFSRGVALARVCNQHIVDSSLQKLEELRQSGTQHQLIAVACSINHAKEIRSLYQERGFTADVIHSKQSSDEQADILAALRNGTLDCIIQVQMLGEGFDHPKLSVAAIFRPFRTLAPYIQFVGRVMRVVVQNDPTHPDNMGHIVTHLGMNLDQRLKEFKDFENDDQSFWDKVIGGEEPEVSQEILDGTKRLRAGENVVVHGEIVDSLWEEDFTSLEDAQIVEDIRERFKLLGLDPSQVEEMVKRALKSPLRKQEPTAPFLVQPQREWEEARKRLNEQSKRLATLLLNHVELNVNGTELTYKYRSLKLSGRTNFISALTMVNHEINKRLGKDRGEASIEEFREILDNLDDLLQTLARRVRKAKSDYDKENT
ncbi:MULTISPECIES: DEAD/DEAH box helicase [unclassified Rhizobium]|uniref:DEAD/DEAH box helicase n=2 Tax=Rhizobium TaxID=379 RepID=UPI001ADAF6D7|nr:MULTISPECIES: DEAD/DEAH box helicase family protein [unclassified Rhizobium]MBO9102052.1 DEAD/DEAH box helicase family protein [Rhizobium sp. L58/93]MBO9172138.1 DEAD/DEAH box helicase family protein [Rhizobium sp. L245/93]QXZ88165.1 DEAD/DEAH box helicase family protein [Rhizobium sp. K1/93]QXZ94339.1 DEAD/DEAH box helicase family protein [Rhizobium sp. K15/93]